jgi:DNA-binding FadR family transcriptional regulator
MVREKLPPGSMLPTEKDMVESYNVGRTTMREALRLLETRGVITIRSGPRGGPVVRRPNSTDLGEALTLILQFEEASLADVMEARQAFEPIMTRLAAKKITEEQLDLLQESVDLILEDLDDHEVFQTQNQRFHGVIAQSSGSAVLHVFNDTLKSIADGILVGIDYTPNHRKAVALAHQRVIDEFRMRDADRAEEMMRLHLDEAAKYWNRQFSELTSQPLHWIH